MFSFRLKPFDNSFSIVKSLLLNVDSCGQATLLRTSVLRIRLALF